MAKKDEVEKLTEKFSKLPKLGPRAQQATKEFDVGRLIETLANAVAESGIPKESVRIAGMTDNQPDTVEKIRLDVADVLENLTHLSVLIDNEAKAEKLLSAIGDPLETFLRATKTVEPVEGTTITTMLLENAVIARNDWIEVIRQGAEEGDADAANYLQDLMDGRKK